MADAVETWETACCACPCVVILVGCVGTRRLAFLIIEIVSVAAAGALVNPTLQTGIRAFKAFSVLLVVSTWTYHQTLSHVQQKIESSIAR